MMSLKGYALGALIGSFTVAAACSSPNRSFDAPGTGGDAGDSSEAGSGGSNHAGNAGTTSHAGASGHGGASSAGGPASGGDAGTDTGDAGSGNAGTGGMGNPSAGSGGTTSGGTTSGGSAGSAGTGGSPVMCTTPLTACSNTCVNLKSDAKNCSVCGHSCLGGVCDTGTCQPVNVVTGQAGVNNLETDGTYVYWTGHGTPSTTPPTVYYVARRRADATDAVKVLAPSEVGGTSLALSNDKIYWIAGQKLRSCDLPDCTTGATDAIAATIHSSQGYDLLFEPTKKGLYVSSFADYNATNGAITLLASGSTTLGAVGPSPLGAAGLVSDAANVYWLASSTYTADNLNTNGGVYRQRVSDGVVTQLVSNLRAEMYNLAVGGNALFVQGNSIMPVTTTAIIRVPLPNGLAVGTLPKFADASTVYGMFADDAYLYYAQAAGDTGTINRCAVTSTTCAAPEVIQPGILNPSLAAEDALSIYWKSTTYLPGGASSVVVQRLAK